MKIIPQEIEFWYLIPAIRRELAKIFISDFGMSQRQVSETLGITESAISQYIKSKRGNELHFNRNEYEKIKETAEEIFNKGNANENLYKLCTKLRACESLCIFHKKQDKSLPKNCDLCLTH